MDNAIRLECLYIQRSDTRRYVADSLYEAARKYLPSMKMRTDFPDGDADQGDGFFILRHPLVPAVLTENGFFTNAKELEFLETRASKQAIIDLHVEGIIEYLSR